MTRRWIAIVTRTEAKIFTERPFNRVAFLRNSLGREKNREMTTDKPGVRRPRFSGLKGLFPLSGSSDPHEDAAVAFAKTIGEFLRKASAVGKFEGLTIVAEPKMLGRLKKELDKNLLSDTDFIHKDLGGLKSHELADFLGLERPIPRVQQGT